MGDANWTTAWLIEKRGLPQAMWLKADGEWTLKANEALWFVRESDAAAHRIASDNDFVRIVVCEHAFARRDPEEVTAPSSAGGGVVLLACPFCGQADIDDNDLICRDLTTKENVIRCGWCHGAAPKSVWNRRAESPLTSQLTTLTAERDGVARVRDAWKDRAQMAEANVATLTAELRAYEASMRVHDEEYEQQRRALDAATSREAALREALDECEAYFDNRADVKDGSYGEPAPNEEMRMLQIVRQALAGKGERS